MSAEKKPWNLWMKFGAVQAADNGVKQLSLVLAEKLYREFKTKNDPTSFIHTTSSGSEVTVLVHEGKKCPLPPPS